MTIVRLPLPRRTYGADAVGSSTVRGKNYKKNQAKKIRGHFEPSDGRPIRTRTKADGMNFRCPCGSGKKSRNCCKIAAE